MLDIKYIVENSEAVKKAMQTRNGNFDIDGIIRLDSERKEVLKAVESQKALRNKVSEEIAVLKKNKQDASDKILAMKEVGEDIKQKDERLAEIEIQIKEKLEWMPNIPHDSVPKGKDESFNVEVKKHGVPPTFDFDAKPHWELGESLNILDSATAGKITGTRFVIYKGLGAKLERALISFMLDTHSANGYTELLTPFMVNRESMFGTGQLPKFEEDAFALKDTNYFMVPTAEVPVTNIHRGEILSEEQLPIKYCAYTPCFRAEAGSAGRDTRGLIRMHQFNKVELVRFMKAEDSLEGLESLTSDAESILQKLGLAYRVVCLSTGDIGFSSAKTYDIEVWMPSYNKYIEISSCSNFSDFQARRMNIRYRNKDGKTAFVHTLNGSGLAIGRTVAAIMENFQTKEGEIIIPKALHPYINAQKISK